MNKFLIFALVIVAGIFGILGYWNFSKNTYSKDILKLEILGKENANLLEEVNYVVKYKNNGNVRLEDARLIFEYPSYSVVEDNVERKEVVLGTIYPGEEKTISFKARLLGKEGDLKIAKATLTYRPKELKARYESSTTYTTVIKEVPLTFDLDFPSKIEPGKEITLRVNYFSNIDYPISDLGILMDYPEGFEVKEVFPESLDNQQWNISFLNKADGGRIEIKGIVAGQVGEIKKIKGQLGVWREGSFIPLKEVVKAIALVEPHLYITQEINGNPQYVAKPGETLHYEIIFKNIGEKALENLFLVVNLEGQAFDFSTLKTLNGEFTPGDNSIVFDWRRVSKLRLLGAQEEGRVEFWINLKEDWGEDKNPTIKTKVYLSQAREEFTTKVSSKVEVAQKVYFQDEIFGNSGPLPPKVGQSTTYTVIWSAKNFYNDLKNVRMKAVLPQNVNLTGKIFPDEEKNNFTFDSRSRELVWNIEDLPAQSQKNLSFQVAFIPDSSQVGKTPILIEKAVLEGEDQWTTTTVTFSVEAVDTTLPDDESVSPQQGQVVN